MDETFDDFSAEAIADVSLVRGHLLAAAGRREAVSYSELLIALGHRFTRPKMRAVCRTLDAIDRAASDAGEPELAVLVVRESDGLPGQGWWAAHPRRHGYEGPWSGPEATAFVKARQALAFDHWSAGAVTSRGRRASAHPSAAASRTSGPR